MKRRSWHVVMIAALVGGAASAEVFHVAADGSGDYPTIQAAVDAASSGDVVLLEDGVYRGEGNRDIDTLGKSLTIASRSGDPARVVMDCASTAARPHRAFRLVGGSPVLEGITMTNGGDSAWWAGGAVLIDWCIPTITRCVFARNRALVGGAIAAGYCALSVSECTFYGNEARPEYGGSAIWLDDWYWGPAQISHTIIAAGIGAPAITTWGTPVALQCCNIHGNAGGDYVGSIAGQLGVNGNICADPLFCDPENLDLSIAADSPCAPGGECGLMGALPVGCGPTPAEATTWGAIKGLYR
ncbi:MAG: hypothetical protein FJY75_11630 [Candidatus Eisenbacteria bacterium]|uniref:Right handed beta helix domain-containing protein n=1 Tax=Eiseniibacteriota bacterium TaxID=2212470 RepID=A0A937XDK5_UNCEI|nr:hypothetical protein [Candidatus Eisenbacteria bacterium]